MGTGTCSALILRSDKALVFRHCSHLHMRASAEKGKTQTHLGERGQHGYDLQGGGGHVSLGLGGLGTVLLQQHQVTAAEAALLHDPFLWAPAVSSAGGPA